MKNLAGVAECDDFIRQELTEAGIQVICLPGMRDKHPEVKASLFGLLGANSFLKEWVTYPDAGHVKRSIKFEFLSDAASFRFQRHWYYWSAYGYVPMTAAVEMYESEIGRHSIRVEGHCGCPDPREYVASRPLVAGQRCVSAYHIDTQDALNMFVATLRKHNLFDEYQGG